MTSGNTTKITVGALLVVFGAIWLASNFVPGFEINWEFIWPLFLIVPGVLMWVKYLSQPKETRNFAILVPANALIFLGITFYINIIGSDVFKVEGIWAATAFLYPGSVALAFWVTYLASKKEVGLLIPAGILSMVSLFILCSTSAVALIGGTATEEVNRALWPILIICLGFFVLLSPFWAAALKQEQRWMGKTAREWESWSKEFGKKMDQWGQKVDTAFEEGSKAPEKNVDEAEIVEKSEPTADYGKKEDA